MDQIIAEINDSRFVVADLTGARGGVYYEGGYARGHGLPVIWTCHGDWAEKIQFDVNHINQIRWTDPPELLEKIENRI
ncbi:hypothetical protein OAS39_04160 [Pirellulales bacterium]|nr:hypothetical protein [Pirellulales bacterium]